GIRGFWQLLLPAPDASAHVKQAAVRSQIGWTHRQCFAYSKSGSRKQREQHGVLAIPYGRKNLLQISVCDRGPPLLVPSDYWKLDEIVIPSARIDLLAFFIHR